MYALNLRNSAASLVLPTELRHLTKHQYLLMPSGPDCLKSRSIVNFYQINMKKEKLEPVCMLDSQ